MFGVVLPVLGRVWWEANVLLSRMPPCVWENLDAGHVHYCSLLFNACPWIVCVSTNFAGGRQQNLSLDVDLGLFQCSLQDSLLLITLTRSF